MFWGYSKLPQKCVIQAWTEGCHQISCDWEVQTMWNLLKKVWYVGEARLCQKLFTNRLIMNLLLRALVEKTVRGVEKILNSAVSKEGHGDSLLGHERPITIDFFEIKALFANFLGNIPFIYEISLVYIYMYIYAVN